MWQRIGLAIALVGICGSQAASAEPFVTAGSSWGGAGMGEIGFGSAGPVASAFSRSDATGGFGFGIERPLPPCSTGPDGPCDTSILPSGVSVARAEANGLQGVLRGRAAVIDPLGVSGWARSQARLTDTVEFLGSKTVGFDIDLLSTLTKSGSTALSFSFGLVSAAELVLAELSVFAMQGESGLEQGYVLTQRTEAGTISESGDAIPRRITFSSDLGWLDETDSYDLFFDLGTFAEAASDGAAGAAVMASDSSAYIRIEDARSLSGYNYPGRSAPPVDVAEPGMLMLLAAGFLGLALGARRPLPRDTSAGD